MGDLFRLKNQLRSQRLSRGFSSVSLFHKAALEVRHIASIRDDAKRVLEEYSTITLIPHILVCAHYKDVVSKSRRIKTLFKDSKGDSDSHIVGARLLKSDEGTCHLITYYVPKKTLLRIVEIADEILLTLQDVSTITEDELQAMAKEGNSPFRGSSLKSRLVASFLSDCSNISSLHIPHPDKAPSPHKFVTIYDTGLDIRDLFSAIGLGPFSYVIYDNHSASITDEAYEILIGEAGYMVAMSEPFSRLDMLRELSVDEWPSEREIPLPENEPVIGVIDTSFDKGVYFSRWVNVDEQYRKEDPVLEDMAHATEVCSIIVDGPSLNPSLDDHCGRFRVRLFPVAGASRNSWINIAHRTRKIIANNPDIHVWNLSLGSELECDESYISTMGALLDQLQAERPDILFVVAGTNLRVDQLGKRVRVGSPADSINCLVVNSVDWNGNPSEYSRSGPVLSFFRKPDISYYGGSREKGINVIVSQTYGDERMGTSFAAPWIARKAAFMMDIMGFSRDETKALLLNSALSFSHPITNQDYLGYGVAPIAIEDVIEPKRDEIRFLIKGVCKEYYTYTYDLPVPMLGKGFPFKSRIVMSTTLHCDRNKGVDYTNEELTVSFGRMKKGKIKTIDNDNQDEVGNYTNEETTRSLFRKWDNIKVISETFGKKSAPLKAYDDNGLWGIRITSKLRNDSTHAERNSSFAILVTLKEIYGQERADEFERRCLARGWIVERISVESKLHLYNIASGEIKWK